MSVTLVSTFSENNYKDYAKYFLRSAAAYIKKDIKVRIYTDVEYTGLPTHFENYVLKDSIPELQEFKKRNKHRPVPQGTKGFIKDAVKFSHKSYTIIHASRTVDTKRLIWLDADTEFKTYVDKKYLGSKLPKGYFVSYLGREDKYTETGFLQFFLNRKSRHFFNKWQWYYDTDEIYNLDGQLDCHVFDACLKDFPQLARFNLSPKNAVKNHFNIAFNKYMQHYKGSDKQKRTLVRRKVFI